MLAVGPAMDRDCPQHEPPRAGSLLYSPLPLQSAMLHCPYWNTFSLPPYPAFSSDSRPFMSSASFLGSQPCPDTSYAPVATASSLPPKTCDFAQKAKTNTQKRQATYPR
ncbi:protein strawberry notch homolog 2-like isoform X6 [Symphalangus syndactylus]|uniref:protein strawberry notch homolog 2-like isoform X6 n=1 Tax=Symphalangus syndactylus TaxID=9590 RepID=UPI003006B70D